MNGKYSIIPFMATAVALASNAYGHFRDCATWIWFCLLQSVIFGIDDDLDGGQDVEHMYRFNERFVNCHPQGNPALEALDTLLREAPRYYIPLISNLVTTSILHFMSSILLDRETKDTQVSVYSNKDSLDL